MAKVHFSLILVAAKEGPHNLKPGDPIEDVYAKLRECAPLQQAKEKGEIAWGCASFSLGDPKLKTVEAFVYTVDDPLFDITPHVRAMDIYTEPLEQHLKENTFAILKHFFLEKSLEAHLTKLKADLKRKYEKELEKEVQKRIDLITSMLVE